MRKIAADRNYRLMKRGSDPFDVPGTSESWSCSPTVRKSSQTMKENSATLAAESKEPYYKESPGGALQSHALFALSDLIGKIGTALDFICVYGPSHTKEAMINIKNFVTTDSNFQDDQH